MENLIQKELYTNAKKRIESPSEFSPSYQLMRSKGLEYFNDRGIPSKKDEDWIYTNIAKNLAPRFTQYLDKINNEQQETEMPLDLVFDASALLIFNNGHFNRDQSRLPKEMTKSSPHLSESFHDSFDALNLAVASDPVSFHIPKNTANETPITLLHLTDESAVNKQITPRIHFDVEANANAVIIEVFTSTQNNLFQYTTNAHTSFTLHQNAKVKHIKINLEAKLSTHIALTKADVARDGQFETFLIDLGNQTARHNIEVHLNNENAHGVVDGLFTLKNSEHSDIFSSIFHHAPHTTSEQLYKGIINHTAHGAFTGKIVIDEGAAGVNANQLNKNILLSKKAHIDTRPQLLVSADDVKCSHGATVGELSGEEEFYLISRGINKARARKMLALGFAHEVLLRINHPKIFTFINQFLSTVEFES